MCGFKAPGRCLDGDTPEKMIYVSCVDPGQLQRLAPIVYEVLLRGEQADCLKRFRREQQQQQQRQRQDNNSVVKHHQQTDSKQQTDIIDQQQQQQQQW